MALYAICLLFLITERTCISFRNKTIFHLLLFYLVFYIIILGRNNTRLGTNTSKRTFNMSAIRKGIIPLNIVCIGTSGAVADITYTFIPTGGVIIAISIALVIKIPNQIGLMPSAIIKGKKNWYS